MAGATNDEIENKDKEVSLPQEVMMKHPLQYRWTLWYLEMDKNKTWEEMQMEVTSFETVEDFWSLFNHIKNPSEIKIQNDYSLFKEGIRPMWEDSANRQGGKWSIQLPRSQRSELDDIWLNTVLLLIGEAFEHTDQICGAVVNVRGKADKISIWTADGTNRAACLDIGRKMKERLGYKGPMYYHMHSDSMVKNSSQVKAAYQV